MAPATSDDLRKLCAASVVDGTPASSVACVQRLLCVQHELIVHKNGLIVHKYANKYACIMYSRVVV